MCHDQVIPKVALAPNWTVKRSAVVRAIAGALERSVHSIGVAAAAFPGASGEGALGNPGCCVFRSARPLLDLDGVSIMDRSEPLPP